MVFNVAMAYPFSARNTTVDNSHNNVKSSASSGQRRKKMKPPKRLFRERRRPAELHDRRVVEHRRTGGGWRVAGEGTGNPEAGDSSPPTLHPSPATQTPDLSGVLDLAKHVVYVPVHRFIDTDTYHCLRGLEDLGIRVDYSKGASAIDVTRNILASDAIREDLESILFIDSDMMFDPADAVRLFLRPEPVVAGVYAAKKLGNGQLNADFGPDVRSIKMGEWAAEPVPCFKVGAGFLRIKVDFLRRMRDELKLPLCRVAHTHAWPFFQPAIVQEEGETRYLGEDYSFCWRCRQIGVPVMIDASFRLYHIGDYAFGWEESAGQFIPRNRNLEYQVSRP